MSEVGPPVVRFAAPADADVVAALLDAFNREFDTPTPGVAVLARRLVELLASSTTIALLAVVTHPPAPETDPSDPSDPAGPGAAVGVALLTLRRNVWFDGPVGLLDELYVVPDRRGRGTGTALLAAAESAVRARDGALLEIPVDGEDVDARRFYERHGYRDREPAGTAPLLYYSRDLGPR